MKAIITVGMGFGDEGKGATVDFLTRSLNADLVVRYSGGAQAGHNVELPSGDRHTFSQFGSGTLAGAPTYLGPRVIVCPATLTHEANHLKELGINDPERTLSLHPDCLLSTSYHMAMNRLRERARGAGRHGSCGLGIGETRSYWLKHGQDAIVANDLFDRNVLESKLRLLRDRTLLELQEIKCSDASFLDVIYSTTPNHEAELLVESIGRIKQSREIPPCELAIFEGAQGVLLDEYFGFHPHTTWSTVTAYHALEMLQETSVDERIVLGISRAYSTRHGAGPFPTFCPDMTRKMIDPGNPKNDWQGGFQNGPLDLVLLNYAVKQCPIDGWVINHMDQISTEAQICRRYRNREHLMSPKTIKDQEIITGQLFDSTPVVEQVDQAGLLSTFEQTAPIYMIGNGPSFQDKRLTPLGAEVLESNYALASLSSQ